MSTFTIQQYYFQKIQDGWCDNIINLLFQRWEYPDYFPAYNIHRISSSFYSVFKNKKKLTEAFPRYFSKVLTTNWIPVLILITLIMLILFLVNNLYISWQNFFRNLGVLTGVTCLSYSRSLFLPYSLRIKSKSRITFKTCTNPWFSSGCDCTSKAISSWSEITVTSIWKTGCLDCPGMISSQS